MSKDLKKGERESDWCSICGNPTYAGGICKFHYSRKKQGYKEPPEEIPMPIEDIKTNIGTDDDHNLWSYIFFMHLKEKLIDILDTLTSREEKVIRLRFGLDDGSERTRAEVGKEFKVTSSRIMQIEAKALRKLRHPSRSNKLRDFLDCFGGSFAHDSQERHYNEKLSIFHAQVEMEKQSMQKIDDEKKQKGNYIAWEQSQQENQGDYVEPKFARNPSLNHLSLVLREKKRLEIELVNEILRDAKTTPH